MKPSLALIIVLVLSIPAIASQDDSPAEETIIVSMDELQDNPGMYYGKTVTVDGELHRTFTDNVFTIEDDGLLFDHDILIISSVPKSEAVTPLDGSLEDGMDVRVTGVVQPYDRAKLEREWGPLNLESHEGHSFTKNPVLIIDRRQAAMTPTPEPEPPEELAAAEPEPEPMPAPAPAPEPEPEPAKTLPTTSGYLALLGIAGLLSICASFLVQRQRFL